MKALVVDMRRDIRILNVTLLEQTQNSPNPAGDILISGKQDQQHEMDIIGGEPLVIALVTDNMRHYQSIRLIKSPIKQPPKRHKSSQVLPPMTSATMSGAQPASPMSNASTSPANSQMVLSYQSQKQIIASTHSYAQIPQSPQCQQPISSSYASIVRSTSHNSSPKNVAPNQAGSPNASHQRILSSQPTGSQSQGSQGTQGSQGSQGSSVSTLSAPESQLQRQNSSLTQSQKNSVAAQLKTLPKVIAKKSSSQQPPTAQPGQSLARSVSLSNHQIQHCNNVTAASTPTMTQNRFQPLARTSKPNIQRKNSTNNAGQTPLAPPCPTNGIAKL